MIGWIFKFLFKVFASLATAILVLTGFLLFFPKKMKSADEDVFDDEEFDDEKFDEDEDEEDELHGSDSR